MKKVLFIDRDDTLIIEPEDEQIDSFEKLEFLPGVFEFLGKISKEMDYELVMVTNQDGLGTSSFPEETFWPVHNKMLLFFKNEGIEFSEILIDRTRPEENADTRKPGTGLLQKYIHGNYDLKKSFVIGDRDSDVELAKNLGAQSIKIVPGKAKSEMEVNNWESIYALLKNNNRKHKEERKTAETTISVELNLDGKGDYKINTGLNFFDHMLDQLTKHSGIDLYISVDGDLEIDEHHTIEDTAIVLGKAFKKALGKKKGIERYGFMLPMDESLAQVALDFGGRPWLVWDLAFKRERIGDVPTEMFMHFFKSFSDNADCNLNIKCEGENEHHMIESVFKAFAKSIKMAIKQSSDNGIPSTKGSL